MTGLWCCRDQQRACRMAQASTEKLRKDWRQCPEKAVGKYAGAAFAKRRKNRAVSPEYQIIRGERVKVSENRTLARERGSEWKHEKERVDSTVKEGRFQGGKGGQARRASLEQVEGSMSG